MCHLVLLLPVFGLVVFWVFPFPVAATIYLFILAFSIWMYRAIMSAMHLPVATGSEGMIGQLGEVIGVSGNSSEVLVRGEVWRGKSSAVLQMGQRVRVTGLDRLVLQVEDVRRKSVIQPSHCGMNHRRFLGLIKGRT